MNTFTLTDDQRRWGAPGASTRRRGQAIGCYSIALTLAVLVALFGPDSDDGIQILYMLTPTVAVLLLLMATGGWRLPQVWAELGLRTVGRRGLPWAVVLPFLVIGASYLAGSLVHDVSWELSGNTVPQLVVGILITSVFAFFEEVCWRGYLLPRLAPEGGVAGFAAVGFLHGLWHLPLILLTTSYNPVGSRWIVIPLFLAVLSTAGVFYGWLRTMSASLWPVVIAHGTFNAVLGTAHDSVSPRDETTFAYLSSETGIFTLLAAGLVATVLARRALRPGLVAR